MDYEVKNKENDESLSIHFEVQESLNDSNLKSNFENKQNGGKTERLKETSGNLIESNSNISLRN